MGGQSFKCPYCDRWTLDRRAMRDHLKDRHGVRCKEIVGTGGMLELIGEAPLHSTSHN